MIYLRGVTPDTEGWTINHGTGNFYGQQDLYTRIESGVITEDYIGQYVVVSTVRQHLIVTLEGEQILSSNDYGYKSPIAARYGIKVTEDFVGKEMQIMLFTPYPDENFLMREALSFQRINPGYEALDYSIVAICFISAAAALILAFAFGIRNPGSGALCLFALLNIALALNTLRGDSVLGYDSMSPRLLYVVGNTLFFVYMLPLLVFFYIALTGVWRKFALVFISSTVLYAIAAFFLNMFNILPLGLTDSGYNYILSLSITVLTFMLAVQPTSINGFAFIARIHIALWAAWGLSAAVRLLIMDINVEVNVEYRVMYGLALITLTLYGIYIYATRINELQEREHIMNIRTESLIQNYEQVSAHIHEVNSLKHDIRNHLTAMHLLIKDKRYDEAESYLEKYTIEVGDISQAVYHSNYLINAMMHDLVRRAEALNIKTTLNLNASPFNISDPDLVSLLTNIIENAIEACERLPDIHKRFINLSFTRREPYLAIVCENSNPGVTSTDTEEEPGDSSASLYKDKSINTASLFSSKRGKGYGYGLQTIERISTAYNGMTEVKYNEKTFIITVALKDMMC